MIMPINGEVNYTITLDPTVWIFDDRKVDLDTYFEETNVEHDELEEYTKNISKHWSREIQEGATYPPTLKTEKKYLKEKILTGTFAIPFLPFLENAEPKEGASKLIINTENDSFSFELETASQLLLGFSNKGKPLTEDGPVYIYFKDGSNKQNPIKRVTSFTIE
jgi:hypothetical protein